MKSKLLFCILSLSFIVGNICTVSAKNQVDSFWQLEVDQSEDLYTDYTTREPFDEETATSDAFSIRAIDPPPDPGEFPVGNGMYLMLAFLLVHLFIKYRKYKSYET